MMIREGVCPDVMAHGVVCELTVVPDMSNTVPFMNTNRRPVFPAPTFPDNPTSVSDEGIGPPH